MRSGPPPSAATGTDTPSIGTTPPEVGAPDSPAASELAALERRRWREGIATLVVVQVLYGLFPLFVKLANDPAGGFTPRAIMVWRVTFGAAVLLALAFLRYGRRAWPAPGDWGRLAACALFGVVLNQLLALEGVARTSILDAGLLMTLIPVFTHAFAIGLRLEPFRLGRAVGIAIALTGAAVLVVARTNGAGDPVFAREHLLGDLLIVGNCVSYAYFLVIARGVLARMPSLAVVAWVFALAVLSLPLVGHGQDLLPADLTPSALVGIAYTLVGATFLAYLLNMFALARVSATTTAAFIYLQPLVAGISGFLVLGERPGPAAGLAALGLFVGLGLVLRYRPRTTPTSGPAGATTPGGDHLAPAPNAAPRD